MSAKNRLVFKTSTWLKYICMHGFLISFHSSHITWSDFPLSLFFFFRANDLSGRTSKRLWSLALVLSSSSLRLRQRMSPIVHLKLHLQILPLKKPKRCRRPGEVLPECIGREWRVARYVHAIYVLSLNLRFFLGAYSFQVDCKVRRTGSPRRGR